MRESGQDQAEYLRAVSVYIVFNDNLHAEVGVVRHRETQQDEEHGIRQFGDEGMDVRVAEARQRRERYGKPQSQQYQGSSLYYRLSRRRVIAYFR